MRLPYDVIDLLANCKVKADDSESSNVEYAEIEEMGLWHSTPLPSRHRSKISLTWVLKDNVNNVKQTKEPPFIADRNKFIVGDVNRYQRHNQKFNENERQRKSNHSKDIKDRVVGRNEYYNNYKFKVNNVCDDIMNDTQDSFSEETSAGTGDYGRKKRRHKHRRRKRQTGQSGKFGYDIKDVDCFLSEVCNLYKILQRLTKKLHKLWFLRNTQSKTLEKGKLVELIFFIVAGI